MQDFVAWTSAFDSAIHYIFGGLSIQGVPSTLRWSAVWMFNETATAWTWINGDATFFNQGQIQTVFNAGNPMTVFYAPITLDNFATFGT